jgi:hypothetical protein
MHRFCVVSRLSVQGTDAVSRRRRPVRRQRKRPYAIRIAIVAVIGVTLALGGCASRRTQTAGDPGAKYWGWCDRVQQDRPTVLCFQQ